MKKKGLIISTVVMVVVLIASLTTATYAWFSQTAQATIDNLTINTSAAEGLQIAMTGTEGSIATLYSGDLTYDNQWGGTEGWGSYLGFQDIKVGNLEHAVTRFKANDTIEVFDGYVAAGSTFAAGTDYFTFAPVVDPEVGTTDVRGKFELSGSKYVYTADAVAQSDKTYFSITPVASPVAGEVTSYYKLQTTPKKLTEAEAGYYQPTGYDSNTQPTGYVKVAENRNGTYYYLTMAVTNLMDIGELGFSVEVVPTGNSNMAERAVSATNPGMAAASRIDVKVALLQESSMTWRNAALAPFSSYKLQTNNRMVTGESGGTGFDPAKDGALNDSGKYTCVLQRGGVGANTVYLVTFTIWIEGTDNECSNVTTGTQMQFNINFAYAPESSTINSWNWQNAAGTATTITLP